MDAFYKETDECSYTSEEQAIMVNIRRSRAPSPESIMNENSESISEEGVSKCHSDLNVIQCYRALCHPVKRLIRIEMNQGGMPSLT